ncbi:FecCD family ABC transporter permease [Gephyromycinifex aptenodytis]|uniref:FecCD family ABC transporter permease n=1 Tax=Gephyromycinifex aptenodytis TaxID=2716227 RepID=UPI001444B2BE|nr:iron ABC transporter permease [Gephyromycinifex aptenodytis]
MRHLLLGAVLGLVILVLGMTSLFLGSHGTHPGEVIASLNHFDPQNSTHVIVWRLRLPRFATAVVAGLGLGAATAVIQSMTRNPLAEPGLLGINSGAALFVTLGLVFWQADSAAAMMVMAMLGAAAAGAVVLMVGGAFSGTADPIRLVLAGAAFSAVIAAFTIMLLLNYPSVFVAFRYWDAGGVAPRPWPLILLGAAMVGLGALVAAAAARSLDALALGQDLGKAMGASTRRAWGLGSVSVVILCGSATALVGPIGFLGLAAAVASRRLCRGGLMTVAPIAALFASAVLLAADLIGRRLASPAEMQAGLVCGLLGAPVFVAIARRSRVVTA